MASSQQVWLRGRRPFRIGRTRQQHASATSTGVGMARAGRLAAQHPASYVAFDLLARPGAFACLRHGRAGEEPLCLLVVAERSRGDG